MQCIVDKASNPLLLLFSVCFVFACIFRSNQRISILRGEVESLKMQLSSRKARSPELQFTLNKELKPLLSSLREELHGLEDKFASVEAEARNEKDQESSQREQEKRRLESALKAAKDEKVQKIEQLAAKKSSLDVDYSAELNRIRSKIQAVLEKKVATKESLRQQRDMLALRNKTLQQRLDELRDAAFAA